MKKALNTLLIAMAILLALVACSPQNEVADELVSATLISTDKTRSLAASVDFDIATVKAWKYTAVKADSGLKTGETGTGETKAKALDSNGNTGALSQGNWNFVLYGYSDAEGKKLVCTGSVDNATVIKGDKDVSITVKPSQTSGKRGTLAILDDITVIGNGIKYTGAEYTKTVTVTLNGSDTPISLTPDTANKLSKAEVASGLYKVVITFTDTTNAGASYTAATGTKYVNVYDNLTTTVSGEVDESTQSATITSVGGTVKAEMKEKVTVDESGENTQEVKFSTTSPTTPGGGSGETESKTEKIEVAFPKGSIKTDTSSAGEKEVSLKVEKASVEAANSTYSVDTTAGAVVAGFDFNLTGVTSTEFDAGVTVTTYIEKGLGDKSNLNISYVGNDTSAKKPAIVSYDTTDGKLVFTVYHFSKYVVTSDNAGFLDTITGTFYGTLSEALNGKTKADILVLKDITLGEEDSWTALEISGTKDAIKKITIDGNSHIFTGLNNSLIKLTEYADIVIKNLTLKEVKITTAEDKQKTKKTTGMGAFISRMEDSSAVFENCRLTESSLITDKDTRAGGFVGTFNKTASSPITSLVITNCSVDNTTIKTYGSIGGFIGHGTQDGSSRNESSITVKDSTVSNCTFNSTEDGNWRVGVVIGTVYRGTTSISGITESGNSLSQKDNYGNEIVGSTTQSRLYGRATDASKNSTFYLNGTEIKERNATLALWCGSTSNYAYGKFTDSYFRSSTKLSSESYDKRTVTKVESLGRYCWDLEKKGDVTNAGLGYYVGTVKQITFSDAAKTTEYYDYTVKAGDVLRMEITISDYSGLNIGGNAYSSKDTVTPGAGGVFTPAENSGITTFVVFMKVNEGSVEYSYATEGSSQYLQTKTITYTLAEGEKIRFGFCAWATKGYVSQIQIYQVNYKSN